MKTDLFLLRIHSKMATPEKLVELVGMPVQKSGLSRHKPPQSFVLIELKHILDANDVSQRVAISRFRQVLEVITPNLLNLREKRKDETLTMSVWWSLEDCHVFVIPNDVIQKLNQLGLGLSLELWPTQEEWDALPYEVPTTLPLLLKAYVRVNDTTPADNIDWNDKQSVLSIAMMDAWITQLEFHSLDGIIDRAVSSVSDSFCQLHAASHAIIFIYINDLIDIWLSTEILARIAQCDIDLVLSKHDLQIKT
jgi:hypothetical protein